MAQPEEVIKITIDDVLPRLLERYISAENEKRSMINFIRESAKDHHDLSKEIPKYLRRRYGIYPNQMAPGLAWYLLDEYFKGNVTIKKDEVPQPES